MITFTLNVAVAGEISAVEIEKPSLANAVAWLAGSGFVFSHGRLEGSYCRMPAVCEDPDILSRFTPPCHSSLLEYLHTIASVQMKCNKHGFPYYGMHDFLLRHGSIFSLLPLPSTMRLGVPQHCFANAWMFSRASRGRYLYVEGLASANIGGQAFFPTHHAWLCPADSYFAGEPQAIEVTWETPGLAYYGCPFAKQLVSRVRKKASTVLDDWTDGWPLFRGLISRQEWLPERKKNAGARR